jgi:nucleoid DNA-binding protein
MSKRGKVDKAEIYKQIADETGISKDKVKDAVKQQFWAVHKVMKEDNSDAIRLPYFGIFKVKPGREDYLNEYNSED